MKKTQIRVVKNSTIQKRKFTKIMAKVSTKTAKNAKKELIVF